MAGMTLVQLRDLLLHRQRRTVVAVFLAAFVTGLVVIALLPKEYEATATLFVGENRPISTGASAVQLDEVLARSYAELLDSPGIARDAGDALDPPASVSELEDKVSFEVLTGTRLIDIKTLDREPERAQEISNAYAQTFVDRQHDAAEQAAAVQIEDLRNQIAGLATELREIDAAGSASEAGKREAVASELAAARDALTAAQESVALQGSNVSVATEAEVPGTAARPRTKLYAILAAVLAAILAVLAGLIRNTFDKRLRGEGELIEILDAPVLARIPLQRATAQRDAVAQEAFQFLRTNLRLGTGGHGGVIAVTSSSPGEGKTSVVAGIGRALGSAGERVVAVDCDLRRPRLAAVLGVDGRMGVTNVLVGAHEAVELLRPTEIPDLRVLPAGPSAPNPSALVSTPTFPRMLKRLHRDGEYVLVDTAPVASVADASAVTSAADAVILVVDLETARRDMLIEAREQIRRAGTPIMGIVINRDRVAEDQYLDYGHAQEAAENGGERRSGREQQAERHESA
jgi:succinoglycan biosynthesis transport protein ExoP